MFRLFLSCLLFLYGVPAHSYQSHIQVSTDTKSAFVHSHQRERQFLDSAWDISVDNNSVSLDTATIEDIYSDYYINSARIAAIGERCISSEWFEDKSVSSKKRLISQVESHKRRFLMLSLNPSDASVNKSDEGLLDVMAYFSLTYQSFDDKSEICQTVENSILDEQSLKNQTLSFLLDPQIMGVEFVRSLIIAMKNQYGSQYCSSIFVDELFSLNNNKYSRNMVDSHVDSYGLAASVKKIEHLSSAFDATFTDVFYDDYIQHQAKNAVLESCIKPIDK